jgi:hypothetical protein
MRVAGAGWAIGYCGRGAGGHVSGQQFAETGIRFELDVAAVADHILSMQSSFGLLRYGRVAMIE